MSQKNINKPPLSHSASWSAGVASSEHTSSSIYSEHKNISNASINSEKFINDDSYSNIHPYIGLRGKLSLAWITYPIISFIFVIGRLFIAMNSIDPIIEDIRQRVNKSCDALELATSSLISLPHFMAGPFNDSITDTINSTIRGFVRTLDLGIQALNGIIVFFINLYKSTFRCLLELAVRGSISAVSEAVIFLQGFSNNALAGIKTAIDNSIAGINSSLEGVRNALSNVGGLLNLPEIPTVSIPAAEDLNKVTFPTTGIVNGLDTLNASIPSMDEIENRLTNLISIPFNELRVIINNSMSDIKFNSSILPVPPMGNNIKFCENNLNLEVLDNIKNDLKRTAWIGLSILFALSILLILANIFYIWISHKRFMNKNRENQKIYRWFWDYILFKPAIICFIIGLSGIISIFIQIAILNGVRHTYKDEISESIANFGNTVMGLMNSNLQESSKNDINQNLFGWVNITTTALNNTLNTAVDEIVGFVNTTFGGVPFIRNVIDELLNCLILVKIKGIQSGLTFIKDNSHLGLPRVSENILMIKPDKMNSVISEATIRFAGEPDEEGTGGQIGRLFDAYEDSKPARQGFWYQEGKIDLASIEIRDDTRKLTSGNSKILLPATTL
ncbi:8830_t:CDS:2 [Rhizophagus irregularis]|nr:8830_t:CDS:2 [Rhizophagus irregularis]